MSSPKPAIGRALSVHTDYTVTGYKGQQDVWGGAGKQVAKRIATKVSNVCEVTSRSYGVWQLEPAKRAHVAEDGISAKCQRLERYGQGDEQGP